MKHIRLFFFIFLINIFTLVGCQKSDLFGSKSSSALESELGVGGSCGTMNEAECEMLMVVNEYRVSQGRAALKAYEKCIRMAGDHAMDMVVRDFFSHDSPTETFAQRVARYGVPGSVGENIAMGSTDVMTIFDMWKNSPGHNANMLNANYKSIGVGYYQGHWVQCFTSAVE